MLIKSVTKDGSPISLTPQEALSPAVTIGISKQNNSEFVYWMQEKATPTSFAVHPKDDGYEAFAEGSCMVGKTRVADDKFFEAKQYSFKIQYCSCKNELGLPHVTVTDFQFDLAKPVVSASGPSNVIPSVALESESKPAGGRINSKYSKK